MEDANLAVERVLNEYAVSWIRIEKDLAFSNEATLTADVSDLNVGYWKDKSYIKGTLYTLGFRHIKISKDEITIKFKLDNDDYIKMVKDLNNDCL